MTFQEILPFIAIILFICLKAVSDSIVHHNAYKELGYFFSKEAAEAPKKNWFHKYFPMFYDAWHLAASLQIYIIIFALFYPKFKLICLIIVLSGLLFNLLYI